MDTPILTNPVFTLNPLWAMHVHPLQVRIAQKAAMLVTEEGMHFYQAKIKALEILNLPKRSALPSNEVLQEAIIEHVTLFLSDTQPAELLALQTHALVWLERMAPYEPLLTGAVWQGFATRFNDIDIDVFTDDVKALEFELINQHVTYEAFERKGLDASTVYVLSIHDFCKPLKQYIGVHLHVYAFGSKRIALTLDAKGRKLRGTKQEVAQLIANRSVSP